jgi:dienelactone hydrolase
MKNRLLNAFQSTLCFFVFATASAISLAAGDDVIAIEKAQPPITVEFAPEKPHGWNIDRHLTKNGLNMFAANVPSYNGHGKLLSSWNPRFGKVGERPTFIIVHGGHGVSPGNIDTAIWAVKTLDANVMVLDSYWSRGKDENWKTWTQYGANMRTLDLIAAARFVKSEGADPRKTFVIGDSQGGWTVLRTFTNHNLSTEVKSLLAGGISLYPNCYAKESFFSSLPGGGAANTDIAPPLGNYVAPVHVFTGTADTATPTSQCNVDRALKSAEKWTSFEGATHAWDSPSGGVGQPGVDGKCTKALNVYNKFAICRNNQYANTTRNEIVSFVERHIAKLR